jgi:hypothetical protein
VTEQTKEKFECGRELDEHLTYTIFFIGDTRVLERDRRRPKPDETIEKKIAARRPHHRQGEKRKERDVRNEIRVELGDRRCPQNFDLFEMTHWLFVGVAVRGTVRLFRHDMTQRAAHTLKTSVLDECNSNRLVSHVFTHSCPYGHVVDMFTRLVVVYKQS